MTIRDLVNDDEALARALQQQYEEEFRRSQTSQGPTVVRGSSTRNTSRNQPQVSSNTTQNITSNRSGSTHQRNPSSSSNTDRPQSSGFGGWLYGSAASSAQPNSQQSRRPQPSAPVAPALISGPENPDYDASRGAISLQADAEFARRLQQQIEQEDNLAAPVSGRSGISSLSADDEDYARQVQREIEREEAIRASARHRSSTGATGTRFKRSHSNAPTSSMSSDDVSALSMISEITDAEAALRIEQELRDEALARRISSAEQDRASARMIVASQPAVIPPRCTIRKIISYLIPLLLIVGAVAGIVYYFLVGRSNLDDWWPSPEDFRAEDPFDAKQPGEADRWQTKRSQGLSLEVVSSLEEKWYPFFNKAVSQWDEGDPDALALNPSFQDYNFDCDPINFKLRVCNGDYGDTRWRGINKILLQNGYIFASSARLNEYYFRGGTSDDQRQYTMCHEIGHGFGLPHSDESFTNADLGNCMDYTNNPKANMQPDAYNFEFLAELYGVIPSSNNDSAGDPTNENVDSAGKQKPGGRYLQGSSSKRVAGSSIPEWVVAKWRELDHKLENHAHGSEKRSGWRLLDESRSGEAHELDIGGGYVVQVHKLLA